jgi:fatty acid desaturase
MVGVVRKVPEHQLLECAALNRRFREAGLMQSQLRYYAITAFWILGLLCISIMLLNTIGNSWIQIFGNASLLAFLFAQIGFVGHDAGHQQIFLSRNKNLGVTWMVMLLSGMVGEWWHDKHVMRHHRDPNGLGDGDIITPFAFTPTQALNKKGWLARFIVKNQAWMFYFILLLTGFSFKLAGIIFLLKGKEGKRSRHPKVEWTLLAVHFMLYFGLLFWLLNPWWLAFPFIVVHQMLLGFYMGNVFAPNHKGMPTIEIEGRVSAKDWARRQITTARDVSPSNPIVSGLYGGLNCQVEHHLSLSMPRNNLVKAAKIVNAYCQERGIPYHQTGIWQSIVEIWKSFQRVANTLPKKAASPV